ncbi:BRO-N domain-containing protein [Corynebacterium halotolerans]|uniref:BRO domain-containing protein n=1 Tax=Corynebacterium halotolerans YIM 70093 = DSM 44683 TaxID=1121362 RepID=M1NQ06_9CORY|nr:BRO domain-containing protein [Corynebacterium halotolerans YIM 70093 = DSM 44683]
MRTFTIDGAPWFVLADVCRVLEMSNPRQVKSRLASEYVSTVIINDGSQRRHVTAVNESGLYDVVLDSRKPQAREFRRWVTSEVIPSIRQTGRYVAPGAPQPGREPVSEVIPTAVAGRPGQAGKRAAREAVLNVTTHQPHYPRMGVVDGGGIYRPPQTILRGGPQYPYPFTRQNRNRPLPLHPGREIDKHGGSN